MVRDMAKLAVLFPPGIGSKRLRLDGIVEVLVVNFWLRASARWLKSSMLP